VWSFPTGTGLANVGYGLLRSRFTGGRAELWERLRTLLPEARPDEASLQAHHLPFSTHRPRPGRGRVLLAGQDLFAMSDAERTTHRATSMGFIFQAFNLIPVFTAAENVELPLLLGGTSAKEARRRAVEMLERVGLGDRVAHRPNELSGGEQQRVTVARALASRPAIVWADEPTGNLDTQMATQVVDLLHELNRQDGQTIVLVTHDPVIGESAGRLLRMRDGRLVGDEQRPHNDHSRSSGERDVAVRVEG
jgi:predicted ABC-type transport system involved in lysophospholipase L1 biosynthesis ATPase subunit